MTERTAIRLADQRPLPPGGSGITAGQVIRALDRSALVASPHLYIHVPFCFHKCHYCDFYSIVDTQDRQGAFVDRLARELASLAPLADGPLETIFIGGGTPSLLRVDLWVKLLADLGKLFDLSLIKAGSGEFTVECNPETVSAELMGALRAGGTTRVSIGAQSFESRHLKSLERWHQPENVARSIELARSAGITRQSIDLIFGIPGQTSEEWGRDLGQALALGTEHLSCYNLTYEPNTAMTARLNRGEFKPADEDVEVEMFALTLETLRKFGLDRYEVSNFAKPGAECRHNMAYWRQAQWLAAGPSASAHFAGYRWKNTPRLDDYLRVDDAGFAPIVDLERPDPRRALRERIMTALRLAEGIDHPGLNRDVARECGSETASKLVHRVAKFIDDGWIEATPRRWTLTDRGFLFADTVAAELMKYV